MTAVEFTRFLHVICGVIFCGVILASFFYIAHSVRRKDNALLLSALKASFFLDLLSAGIVIIQFVTAAALIRQLHLSVSTPWITVAFIAFAIVSCLWLLLIGVKYRSLKAKRLCYKPLYFGCNVLMLMILIVIIHDAVMHRSWFLGG